MLTVSRIEDCMYLKKTQLLMEKICNYFKQNKRKKMFLKTNF